MFNSHMTQETTALYLNEIITLTLFSFAESSKNGAKHLH